MLLQDMGRKTVGNDLDNARINFQNVWVPKETLFASTPKYSDNKNCWAPKGAGQKLSELSQLATLFVEADAQLGRIERFLDAIDAQLSACLRKEQIPTVEVIEAIAAAKVKAVETAIDCSWRLKQEVGSYALMR